MPDEHIQAAVNRVHQWGVGQVAAAQNGQFYKLSTMHKGAPYIDEVVALKFVEQGLWWTANVVSLWDSYQ